MFHSHQGIINVIKLTRPPIPYRRGCLKGNTSKVASLVASACVGTRPLLTKKPSIQQPRFQHCSKAGPGHCQGACNSLVNVGQPDAHSRLNW